MKGELDGLIVVILIPIVKLNERNSHVPTGLAEAVRVTPPLYFPTLGKSFHMRHLLGALVLAAGCATVFAQGALEIIPLRHRTADQVLPALRPFLEPGGMLNAHGNQLIVRTSPANLAELRAALAAIDTPPRRLVIHVRHGGSAAGVRRALEAGGSVAFGERPGARATVRGSEARSSPE